MFKVLTTVVVVTAITVDTDVAVAVDTIVVIVVVAAAVVVKGGDILNAVAVTDDDVAISLKGNILELDLYFNSMDKYIYNIILRSY